MRFVWDGKELVPGEKPKFRPGDVFRDFLPEFTGLATMAVIWWWKIGGHWIFMKLVTWLDGFQLLG